MGMKEIGLSLLMLFGSLGAATTTLQEASTEQAAEIQKRIISYYSQTLLENGQAKDEESAAKAAEDAWATAVSYPGNEVFFDLIVSKETQDHYGYLVYSVVNRIANIDLLALEETYKGQGLGAQALQSFEEEAKAKGLKAIRMRVPDKDTVAYFEEMGYQLENGDDPLAAHFDMRKELAS